MGKVQKRELWLLASAGILLAVMLLLPAEGVLRPILYAIPYLILAVPVFREAWESISRGAVLDENFLMVIASLGAFALGLFRTGEYAEAGAILLFFRLGELLEEYASDKSRRSIAALAELRPDHAKVESGGTLTQAAPETVAVGSVIVVDPGERIPLDGTVLEGFSALDTAAITGESRPEEVQPGDSVFSGSVNLSGRLRLQVTREYKCSAAARILELVEGAAAKRSRSERWVTRFARYYTPLVCIGALLLGLLPPVLRLGLGMEPQWGQWLYRALSFLVVSCPCALVISIPLSFFAGLGGACRAGILIKGSDHLEALAHLDTIAFDKTGTLTCGEFRVTDVRPVTGTPQELLKFAALAESASSHPLGRGILRAWDGDPNAHSVQALREYAGFGVSACVDGTDVTAGSRRFLTRWGIAVPHCPESETLCHVALNGSYAGYLVLADEIKSNAPEAIRQLKNAGIRNLLLLTGDREAVGRSVAEALGIRQVFCRLLPHEKAEKVEELTRNAPKGKTVAFVGDGINDAPALTLAHTGIAMGALGSEAAMEAADVVLTNEDPLQVATAVFLARKTLRLVRENIALALTVKALCLILGAASIVALWLAVFADVGVMLLTVLNALRALGSIKQRRNAQ